MTPLRLALVFGGVFILMLIVLFPLRLAIAATDLDAVGLSAAGARGAVWNGELRGLAYGGVVLGDADVALQPLPLLAGTRRLRLQMREGPLAGRAVLVSGARMRGFDAADARVPVQLLDLPAPLVGEIRLDQGAVLFGPDTCRRAEGRVSTDVLRRSAAFLQWTGPELSGELTCQGSAVVAPLSGQDGGTRVDATVRFEGDGRYRVATRVLTSDFALGAALLLAGFQRGPDGLSRVDEGRYRR